MRTNKTVMLALVVALLAGCSADPAGPGADPLPPDGLPQAVSTPSSFTALSCISGGGWRRYNSVTWSGGTSGEVFDIAESTSNDTTTATSLYGGEADDPPYTLMDGHQSGFYYTWIRFYDGVDFSPWVPIAQNPLNYNSCSV
jgi:hypothetical protein